MEKEKQGAAPDSVREQAAQFAVHREPGERIAALENEMQHLATKADIGGLKADIDRLGEKMDANAEAIRELGKMMRWIFGCTVMLLVAVSASMAAVLVLLLLG